MKSEPILPASPSPRPLLLRVMGVLSHSLWSPAADENRFLAGLPITLGLILVMWKRLQFDPLGGYSVEASFAFWGAAYALRFRRRLKERGELARVIVATALFLALLLALRLY